MVIIREIVLQPAPPHPTAMILARACCNIFSRSSLLIFAVGDILIFDGSEMPGFTGVTSSNPVSGLNPPNPFCFN
jgi:hypothetical protein